MPDRLWGRGKGFVAMALVLGACLELLAFFSVRHLGLFVSDRELLDGLKLFGLLLVFLLASAQVLASLFGSDLDEGATAVLLGGIWAWLFGVLALASAVLLAVTALAFQLVIPFWVLGKVLGRGRPKGA
jgi:hypothetical protein